MSADRARLASERVGALVRSARSVAHELGNPVTGIGLQLEILRRRLRGVDAETAANFLRAIDQIAAATARLTDLATHLRDYARLGAGELDEVDLAAITAAAVAAADGTPTLSAPAALRLRGDAKLLRSLVDALLANAEAATAEGGEVAVTLASAAGEAVLVVADTGTGMAAADLPRATSLAFSGWRKPGFGLSISERIAVLHGGSLEVRAVEPKGFLVEVRLPLDRD